MKVSSVEIAKKILKDNIYMTLATADKDNNPWVSPMFYGYDDNFIFYWISPWDCLHSKLIEENPQVALTIFNTQEKAGEGNAVYFRGKAKVLKDFSELKRAIKQIYSRSASVKKRVPEDFLGDMPRRVYKAIPDKIWVLRPPEDVKGHRMDYRVEVELKKGGI